MPGLGNLFAWRFKVAIEIFYFDPFSIIILNAEGNIVNPQFALAVQLHPEAHRYRIGIDHAIDGEIVPGVLFDQVIGAHLHETLFIVSPTNLKKHGP